MSVRKADEVVEISAHRDPWGGSGGTPSPQRSAPLHRQGGSFMPYVFVLLGVWLFLFLPAAGSLPKIVPPMGIALVAAEKFGAAAVICGIGLLGRLYRPAPFTSYCILSAVMLCLMILGSTGA